MSDKADDSQRGKSRQDDNRPVFPLPLSALQKSVSGSSAVQPWVATPQTATRNVARHGIERAVHDVFRSALLPPLALASSVRGTRALYPALPLVNVSSKSSPYALDGQGATALREHGMVSDAVRRAMVARVAQQGVTDQLVLDAMLAVPRHAFVQSALVTQAYIDASLPIGHQQTISKPYIVARMIEVLRAGASLKHVLEIGTGCGYQAAVLARVAVTVFSIERIKPLHELAKSNLRALRVPNLRLHYGDGMLGLPQAAPFDGIILAAAGLVVPQALLEQLTIGGRLVAPVGAASQYLQLITRAGKGEWISETLEPCHFVPLCSGKA